MCKQDKEITGFYDGTCPLCSWEVNHLKNKNTDGHIAFENIHDGNFSDKYPNLEKQKLDDLLHVQRSNGEFKTGIDATYTLWETVGMGRWFAPLKWRWLRVILKPSYKFFAKYRHTITAVLFPLHTYRLKKKGKKAQHE